MCCCEASVLSGKSGDRVDFVSLIWYRKTMTKSGLLVKFRVHAPIPRFFLSGVRSAAHFLAPNKQSHGVQFFTS